MSKKTVKFLGGARLSLAQGSFAIDADDVAFVETAGGVGAAGRADALHAAQHAINTAPIRATGTL